MNDDRERPRGAARRRRQRAPELRGRIVWRNFKRDRLAVAALWLIAAMFVVSYLAPVIANNKPLFMRWEGRRVLPRRRAISSPSSSS